MVLDKLPVLSLADDKARFAQDIGESFQTFGFALVKDFGIDADLIARAWQLSEQFFALPESEKRNYHNAAMAGARGYTPFGVEIAKDAKAHDLKEFWHIGRDLPAGSPLADLSMPPNVWPARPDEFKDVFSELYRQFDAAGATILARIATYLGLGEHWFDAGIEQGNSVMRLLHYPPLDGQDGEAIRAGAHGDINLITALPRATAPGLQVKVGDDWVDAVAPEGQVIINTGMMLERLTNGVLPTGIHRVVASPGYIGERYSVVQFCHPTPWTLLTPLASCITSEHPQRVSAMVSADSLDMVLYEINLIETARRVG